MGSLERSYRRRRRIPDQLIAFNSERLKSREAIIVAARAGGCTCSPDVEVRGTDAFVKHDAWCGLLRRGEAN